VVVKKKHCIPERKEIQDENDIANVHKYANELPNLEEYNQSTKHIIESKPRLSHSLNVCFMFGITFSIEMVLLSSCLHIQ
jgi:hypothetical protein